MTREQRDFLRKQIDAQMRERMERAKSERAQARTHEAHPRLEQSASLAARAEVARTLRALRAGK